MLAPPGSRSSNTNTPKNRSRKSAALQSPDGIVRELQKCPENRKCADCGSRGTQCVNLSVNSFVCMACSGVLREISHKIKGIQHSSFTREEATALQQTNNALVNQIYLAKYNPNTSPIKAPTDNTNLQQLKLWVKRKYVEKAWYKVVVVLTVAHIPPKPQAAQAQQRIY